MVKVEDPDITVDRCQECGGVFLDKGELNALTTGMAGDIEFCSVDEEKHGDRFAVRKCPRCPDEKMRKENLLAYSRIIFDFCPRCEGFYLDKSEIERTNAELEYLTPYEQGEEYRGRRDNHLVRLDIISSAGMVGAGPFIRSVGVFFVRLTVYFEKPLGLGLRMSSEKWTDKIAKLIGLFKGQDIQADEELDSAYIIQGRDSDKVKDLLSSEELKRELLDFATNKPQIFTTPGTLEIGDDRIMMTEGPYEGAASYDVEENPSGVVARVLRLARLFEQSQKRS